MSSEQNVMSFGKMFSELISFGQMYLRLNFFRTNVIRANVLWVNVFRAKLKEPTNSILEMMKLKWISRAEEKYKMGN
jgi:hypothetical protein